MTKLSAKESALGNLKTSCRECDNILELQENGLKISFEEADDKCVRGSEVLT